MPFTSPVTQLDSRLIHPRPNPQRQDRKSQIKLAEEILNQGGGDKGGGFPPLRRVFKANNALEHGALFGHGSAQGSPENPTTGRCAISAYLMVH